MFVPEREHNGAHMQSDSSRKLTRTPAHNVPSKRIQNLIERSPSCDQVAEQTWTRDEYFCSLPSLPSLTPQVDRCVQSRLRHAVRNYSRKVDVRSFRDMCATLRYGNLVSQQSIETHTATWPGAYNPPWFRSIFDRARAHEILLPVAFSLHPGYL